MSSNVDLVTNENPNEIYLSSKSASSITSDIKDITRKSIIPEGEKLHVVCMMSNPINYRRRVQLAHEFIERMSKEPDTVLYVVEIAYDCNPVFEITDPTNPRNLQLRTKEALWHKENAWSIGTEKLLPHDWSAVAYVDMDIIFESPTWASDAVKILLSTKDPILGQLHSHIVDMDREENAMSLFQGCAYLTTHKKGNVYGGPKYQHPGLTFMMNRAAYDKLGIFDIGIIGSGDYLSFWAIKGMAKYSFPIGISEAFKKKVFEYEKKAMGIIMTYVPGVVRHFYHGSKENRKYIGRNEIMIKHKFDPDTHLVRDKNGLLQPSKNCPDELVKDVYKYFTERKEDD